MTWGVIYKNDKSNLTQFGPKSDIPVFELVKAIGDVDVSDES